MIFIASTATTIILCLFYLLPASVYTVPILASWFQNTHHKFKKRKKTLKHHKVIFILVKDTLSSFKCFSFRNTVLSFFFFFFDSGKICESSRAILTSLMAGSPNLRNDLSLRPKEETKKGFSFTMKQGYRKFNFLLTSAARPLSHVSCVF